MSGPGTWKRVPEEFLGRYIEALEALHAEAVEEMAESVKDGDWPMMYGENIEDVSRAVDGVLRESGME